MIRRYVAAALAWLAFGAIAQAEEDIVLGLNQTEVSIATNFNGSEIIIFGAVKRETPIPESSQLQVVVTVSGPSKPVVVRRKEKKFGIWVNTDSVEVDRAPSFYAVATSGPIRDVLSGVEDLRHKISIPRAIRSVGAPMTITDSPAFTEALIRIRSQENQYQLDETGVTVDQQTLFRATVQLPAALVEGDYDTRIFLTRDGNVVAQYETLIDVRKVGLERWLYNLSREQSLLYGLLSLAIAISAGWLASTAFALIRR
ncbi:conserved hypothetical protein [Sulfitobacter marinus]|uniref:Transmembrane protein (Alph_Pro_TM) n=1 Tax=Sulfitobacter marinus TaxID=394264 RepID=A0A1I6U9V2_9RHOB|nr:TIGR02186 family protein [Sulfitobacter marinus]SFS98220.1 conserved hypothetical protein [Sulfitobacter marinus]